MNNELYLDQLLGRTVIAGNNRPVGRLEEFRSEQRGNYFYIVEFVIGAGGLKQALWNSEDSVKLNTSLVERLNLTIRQGSAYLGRRTICQARWKGRLEDHLELFR